MRSLAQYPSLLTTVLLFVAYFHLTGLSPSVSALNVGLLFDDNFADIDEEALHVRDLLEEAGHTLLLLTNATDAESMSEILAAVDTFVIVEPRSSVALGKLISTALVDFVEAGGTVVWCHDPSDVVFFFPTFIWRETNVGVGDDPTVKTPAAADTIFSTSPEFLPRANAEVYLMGVDSEQGQICVYGFEEVQPQICSVVIAPLGFGHVVFLAHDFKTDDDDFTPEEWKEVLDLAVQVQTSEPAESSSSGAPDESSSSGAPNESSSSGAPYESSSGVESSDESNAHALLPFLIF